MYSDLVFESKPYYIYVDPGLVHHLRQAYVHIVPRNILHRPYWDNVVIKIKVRTHRHQLHDHVNYYESCFRIYIL